MKPSAIPALLTLLYSSTALAQIVISDNFDDGTVSPEWDAQTDLTVSAGGALGSSNYVSLAATTGRLGKSFDPVSPGGAEDFVIDYYFRVQDTTSRQFSLIVSANPISDDSPIDSNIVNNATVNLRYQGGSWAVFDSGINGFTNVSGLPSILAGSWYHMQLEGIDWGQPTASYTLRLSDAGGSTFTSEVSGLTFIQNAAAFPITSSLVQTAAFNTAFGSNPGFDVDEVTLLAVPEPSSLTLGALGLLPLTLRRRPRG